MGRPGRAGSDPTRSLLTIEVASNGEVVMAPPKVRVETCCTRHSTPAITRITTGQPAP